MVPDVAQVEQRKEVGCLAGAGQHAGGAALQLGDFGRHRVAGGVLQAGIEVAAGLQVEQLAHLVGTVILERGALHNGNLARFAVSRVISALHTQGVDGILLAHTFPLLLHIGRPAPYGFYKNYFYCKVLPPQNQEANLGPQGRKSQSEEKQVWKSGRGCVIIQDGSGSREVRKRLKCPMILQKR